MCLKSSIYFCQIPDTACDECHDAQNRQKSIVPRMARDNLARLVGAVLGLVDSVYSGDAQCIVADVPTLAPSFFDEGCPLCVDAIAKKYAIAVVDGLP